MTDAQKEILIPLRLDLQNKFRILRRAQDLNAEPNVLIAIRRKLYQAQDKLLETSVKLGLISPDNWYYGK
jgi:hypothetical protein